MQQYSDSRSSNIRAMVQPDWVLGLVGRLAWPEQHFSARETRGRYPGYCLNAARDAVG